MPARPILLLLCFAALAAAPARAADPGPRWPLDLPERYLTSNFMESRPGRFHAGLDLKTRSESGFPAYAVTDGWLSRISFGPGGYGKALYLNGDDGRIYVYAHLERLADPWRALVREAQARRGRYDVSLYFPKGAHPVRRGDVLALTGQTGTSGPHLHFEVRDAHNRPLDPQACGFAVDDAIPPRLLGVRVHPAGPTAAVDGRPMAAGVTAQGDAGLPAELPDLAVRGPIAVSLRLDERTDAAGHRLAPWRLAVTLDDSLVYESRNERLDFGRNGQAVLEWLRTDDGLERWLLKHPLVALDGRTGGDWSLDPRGRPGGAHVVRIAAEDRAGNRAQTAWRLLADGAVQGAWPAAPVRAEPPAPLEGVAWLDPFQAELEGRVVPLDTLAARLDRTVGAVHSPDALAPDEAAAMRRTQGLQALGWGRVVYAADWPLGRLLDLAPAWADTLPAGAGVYLAQGDGWSYYGQGVRTAGAWRLDVGGAGRFQLCVDDQAPYLGPGPEEGLVHAGPDATTPAVTPPRWEIVPIRLEDLGSGVDSGSLEALWDGTPFWPEPDPPRRRVLVEPPADAAPGPHRLLLRARDRAGNVSERSYTLHLIDE